MRLHLAEDILISPTFNHRKKFRPVARLIQGNRSVTQSVGGVHA